MPHGISSYINNGNDSLLFICLYFCYLNHYFTMYFILLSLNMQCYSLYFPKGKGFANILAYALPWPFAGTAQPFLLYGETPFPWKISFNSSSVVLFPWTAAEISILMREATWYDIYLGNIPPCTSLLKMEKCPSSDVRAVFCCNGEFF